MRKKMFVSVPCCDDQYPEQVKLTNRAHDKVSELFGSDHVALISRSEPDAHIDRQPYNALHYLGYNLQQLATADIAIFAPGWETDRSCVIEEHAARLFGINRIFIGGEEE